MQSRGCPSADDVTQYLDENLDLLEAVHEQMTLGRAHFALQYQLSLQQNLIYLATHADEDPNLRPLDFVAQPPPQQPPQQQQQQQQQDGSTSAAAATEDETDAGADGANLPNSDELLHSMLQRRQESRGSGS